MKKLSTILGVLALLMFVANLSAKSLNKQGKLWLDQHNDPPQVNVNGTWNSEFGPLSLIQAEKSAEVNGQGGGYQLDGVVSGKTLYLLFADKRGGIAFCAEATADANGGLVGQYHSPNSHLHFGGALCQEKGLALTLTKK